MAKKAASGRGKPKRASKPSRSKPSRTKATQASLQTRLKKIDRELLQALNQRARVTTQYLGLLPDQQRALYDPQSDDELWMRLEKQQSGPLPFAAIRGIYRELLSASRRAIKTKRVIYLGPQFSYTHLAAIERFGKWADLIPVNTIAAVFEEVNRGDADYGIVPIENSTDGRIVDTLDMFTKLPLRICGEVQIAINHHLLARCPRSEISEIYSKPQALSQCREWLSRNMSQARLIEVTSTSTAAQLARDKPGAAAVASRQAGIEYDIPVVAAGIQDNEENVTRFAVIGDDELKPTGKDRTAVLLQVPHRPGSLATALSVFQKNKLNLTWIESFPLRGPESGYLFFLDFEGHGHEARTKRALSELADQATRLEILGSYPRSDPLD
ncbi:MAG: prephenate dehydratase [Planctomycetaceae bacterium]|jgi:chorismate mutase/prephenate dehydratase|nr:prephenate dehydratase [Planctomycetaceae bacterium]MDP7275106.1 prephenate dehydratase [Planctomycetaceae bacterium]